MYSRVPHAIVAPCPPSRSHSSGGIVVYGRSDSTLNPGGVRIGTAEIYRVVEHMEQVSDSLAAAHGEHGDVEILLFVVLKEGSELDTNLVKQIKTKID